MARTEFGLHPSNSGGKTAISYLGSPGNNSSSISALQQESESLIRPRNFAALSLGNDSTICSCFAALARFGQIPVARHLPEFAVEGQVVFIKPIEVERLRRPLHHSRDTAQVFDVFGPYALLRPLDGQRFQLVAQAENLLHVTSFQFSNGRAFVRNFLHVPLMFQFDQRLAYQRNARAQLLSDLALDNRLTGLNDPA